MNERGKNILTMELFSSDSTFHQKFGFMLLLLFFCNFTLMFWEMFISK